MNRNEVGGDGKRSNQKRKVRSVSRKQGSRVRVERGGGAVDQKKHVSRSGDVGDYRSESNRGESKHLGVLTGPTLLVEISGG